MTDFKSLNQGQLYQSFDFRKKNKKKKNCKGNTEKTKNSFFYLKEGFGTWTEGRCSDTAITTEADCTGDGKTWTEGKCYDTTITTKADCTGGSKTWTPGVCSPDTTKTKEECRPMCIIDKQIQAGEDCFCETDPTKPGEPDGVEGTFCWVLNNKRKLMLRAKKHCTGRKKTGDIIDGNEVKGCGVEHDTEECKWEGGKCVSIDDQTADWFLKNKYSDSNTLDNRRQKLQTWNKKNRYLWGLADGGSYQTAPCWMDSTQKPDFDTAVGHTECLEYDAAGNPLETSGCQNKCAILPSKRFESYIGKIYKDTTDNQHYYITKYGYAKPVDISWSGCSGLSVEDFGEGGSGQNPKLNQFLTWAGPTTTEADKKFQKSCDDGNYFVEEKKISGKLGYLAPSGEIRTFGIHETQIKNKYKNLVMNSRSARTMEYGEKLTENKNVFSDTATLTDSNNAAPLLMATKPYYCEGVGTPASTTFPTSCKKREFGKTTYDNNWETNLQRFNKNVYEKLKAEIELDKSEDTLMSSASNFDNVKTNIENEQTNLLRATGENNGKTPAERDVIYHENVKIVDDLKKKYLAFEKSKVENLTKVESLKLQQFLWFGSAMALGLIVAFQIKNI